MTIQVSGVNSAEQTETTPYDVFCPRMETEGTKGQLNYWASSCKIRNTYPWLEKTCFPTCQFTKDSIDLSIANQPMDWQQKIRALHKKGLTRQEVAEKLNVSISTVHKYLQPKQQNKFSKKDAHRWYKLYHHVKLTYKQIAEVELISASTARKYILALGG